MSADPTRPPRPVCSRCGAPQPPDGPLLASDGSSLTAAEYLALASLVDHALVCSACVRATTGGFDADGSASAGGT